MRYALLAILALSLGGCLTDREALYLQQQFYSRADIDAINAEAACKRLARDLVQVARCSNRR